MKSKVVTMTGIFLIVDDDVDDRALFCEAITEINPQFECHGESNGRMLLAKVETNEFVRPDIIFLDINMPVMNGWEVLEKLKFNENCRNIPVIMYSTSGLEKDFAKAQRYGALSFLIKPYGYLQLKKCLTLVVKHLEEGSLSEIGNFIPLCEDV